MKYLRDELVRVIKLLSEDSIYCVDGDLLWRLGLVGCEDHGASVAK